MVTPTVDLNADLGEGGRFDLELLEVVTSASVACGGHAGDQATMVETARQAARRGVTVGAHPSYPDREHFGRRALDVPPDQLYRSVLAQLAAMAAAAETAGTAVRFVKPHGALYNTAAADPEVADAVVRAAAVTGLPILGPNRSHLQAAATRAGIACYTEGFADRAYAPDGRLAARTERGSVLEDPGEVARRAVRLVSEGRVTATDGRDIGLDVRSICIHGDTPGAAQLARAVRRALEAAGVSVRSFTPA